MAQFGHILTLSLNPAYVGERVKILAPLGGAFRFVPNRTYVVFHWSASAVAPAATTITPGGVSVLSDYELEFTVPPQVGPGTYPVEISAVPNFAFTTSNLSILTGSRPVTPPPAPSPTPPSPPPPRPSPARGAGTTVSLPAHLAPFFPSRVGPLRIVARPAGAFTPILTTATRLLIRMGLINPALPGLVWRSPLHPLPAAPRALPGASSKNNDIRFLQDGEEFFNAVYDEIQRVSRAEGDSYIHMAFWAANRTMKIRDPLGTPVTLEEALRDAARRGCRIKIMLWDPNLFAQMWVNWVQRVGQTNQDFRNTLDGAEGGAIRVVLRPYDVPRWLLPLAPLLNALMSQHQKIAIFSDGSTARAIVAGLNLSDWYWDDTDHDGRFTPPLNPGNNDTIHDTAVLVEGPATRDIETYWNSEWDGLDSEGAEGPTPTQNQPFNVGINVVLTDVQSQRYEIHEAVKKIISEANDYVFLENYAVIDSGIVNALGERLKQKPDLTVIVLVPHPDMRRGQYVYLHYLTYVELAYLSATNVTFTDPVTGLTVTRARPLASRYIEQANDEGGLLNMVLNDWLDDSSIAWAVGGVEAPFSAITAFSGGVQLYAPVHALSRSTWNSIYIHSKLMLVDDRIAVVGSANFNYRSMNYDGEMSLVIDHPVRVSQIRHRVFNHYGMATAGRWQTTAQANDALFRGGNATPGRTYVVPLGLADFVRVPPTSDHRLLY